MIDDVIARNVRYEVHSDLTLYKNEPVFDHVLLAWPATIKAIAATDASTAVQLSALSSCLVGINFLLNVCKLIEEDIQILVLFMFLCIVG